MPTQALHIVAQKAGIGHSGQPGGSKKVSGKRRLGAAPSQPRVPRAASTEQAVLLNVATHSDGTITYSFGDSSELPPQVATIPLETHPVHHEPAVVAAHAVETHTNGGAAHVTAAPTAVQQLDKLLHLTPKAVNGRNGHNGKADATVSRRLDTASEAAAHRKALEKAAAATPRQRSSHEASSSGVPLDPQAVNYAEASAGTIERLYSRLCDAGRLDDALSVIKDSIRAGREDVLRKLKHYKFLRPAQRQRAVRLALRFIQLIPRQFIDKRTYNMVLSVCAEAGDVKSAIRVADMLRATGGKLDTILYTNLIKTCAAAGDAEQGFQLYSEMRNAGVKTEKQVYATLISACSETISRTPPSDRRTQLVLLERAFALVEQMESSRMHPDAAVWNALVTAAGRAGQLQRAFDVLEQMLSFGTKPNATTYGAMIDACARNADKTLALRVYNKAMKEGFNGELLIYSAAINACVKDKNGADLEAAMDIYADMQRAAVAPDSALFGALIMAAGQAGDLALALDLQAEMQREGLRPCSGTESALLTVHLQNGKLPEAQGIYRRLRNSGTAPHMHAANALVNAFGKEMRLGDVVALVCEMADAGLAPDAFTFAAVLNACQRSDECELGLDVYRVMRLRGIKIDNTIAETMLKMCYSRLRQSWRPGGYPPKRLAEDAESGRSNGRVGSSTVLRTLHSSGGHREQERAKLLAALSPPGRKVAPAADPSTELPWQSHGFNIYRELLSTGTKPSLKLLNLMFQCLRVPWQDATGIEGDQSLNLATQTQRLLAGFTADSNSTPVQGKIGVESIYHVRAISILEEAIVAGVLPSFKADGPPPFDLRSFPPAVAEVYVLTVVQALQRQLEARRVLKNRVVFLVPRYDGHKVFMPSFLREDGQKEEVPVAANNPTVLTTDSEYESDEDGDAFSRALRHDEVCTGDERTGLGVAGVLRRLRLWAREYSPEGLVVIEPREMARWSKRIQREVEKRSASALALQKPYGQPTGIDLLRQSSSIRMGL